MFIYCPERQSAGVRRSFRGWAGVAAAWLAGVVFAPVELIQVGDSSYVRDGHHRISVPRAVGQRSIDAKPAVRKLDAQRQQAPQAVHPSVRGGTAWGTPPGLAPSRLSVS